MERKTPTRLSWRALGGGTEFGGKQALFAPSAGFVWPAARLRLPHALKREEGLATASLVLGEEERRSTKKDGTPWPLQKSCLEYLGRKQIREQTNKNT